MVMRPVCRFSALLTQTVALQDEPDVANAVVKLQPKKIATTSRKWYTAKTVAHRKPTTPEEAKGVVRTRVVRNARVVVGACGHESWRRRRAAAGNSPQPAPPEVPRPQTENFNVLVELPVTICLPRPSDLTANPGRRGSVAEDAAAGRAAFERALRWGLAATQTTLDEAT